MDSGGGKGHEGAWIEKGGCVGSRKVKETALGIHRPTPAQVGKTAVKRNEYLCIIFKNRAEVLYKFQSLRFPSQKINFFTYQVTCVFIAYKDMT